MTRVQPNLPADRVHRPSVPQAGDQRGVTLIELMIAMVVSLIVLGGGYSVIHGSSQAVIANDQMIQVQQNARTAMELITLDLKNAGFSMADTSHVGYALPAVGACGTRPITPADNNNAGVDTGPDQVNLLVPQFFSTLNATMTGPTTVMALQAGSVAGAVAQGLAANSLITINGMRPGGIANIAGDIITLSNPVPAPEVFPGCVMPCAPTEFATPVYWLRCVNYRVDNTTAICGANSAPCLVRDGVPVVDGIEDLQLAYGCDGCVGIPGTLVEDGIIDDQNLDGVIDANDFLSNSAWATTAAAIRLVRLTVVSRQLGSDLRGEEGGVASHTAAAIQAEDHLHSDGVHAAGDFTGVNLQQYQRARHRVLTRTVALRNQGL